jgi:LysR family cyn operon transcriptional activator
MLDRHVRYLLAVAEHGSFTRAAQALHVSQPALSQQIRLLEERLGRQLLDRSGKSIRPTDVGYAYIRHAQRALGELEAGERAVSDVQDLSSGSLRIGYAPSFEAYLIGPLIQRFHEAYPGIHIELKQLSQKRIERDLSEAALDIGIGFETAHTDEVEAFELHEENMSLIVGPTLDSAFSPTAQVSAAELATIPLMLLDRSFVTRTAIDNFLRSQKIEPKVAIEAGSIGPILDMLRLSPLATILPRQVSLNQPGLRVLPVIPLMPSRRVVLLRSLRGYRSRAEEAFVAVATEVAARIAAATL